MIYKKYIYIFLGLSIVFSSSNNANVMTAKRAALYAGLAALGFVGLKPIVHGCLYPFCLSKERDAARLPKSAKY